MPSLNNILTRIERKEELFKMNDDFSTIRYIHEAEYNEEVYRYVEPELLEADRYIVSPRFIIFSAPGATGKTALAKYICYKNKGIFWELPDCKIAEYSFQGAISKAVGYEHVSSFISSLKNGNSFLVIDGFDEAEAGSGRSGVKFFLRDLIEVTNESVCTCAVLLARTESATFIKDYLKSARTEYMHYEVGYFAEHNSKAYIKNKLEKAHFEITSVVEDCINEQFSLIHGIFPDNAKEFLGYAPVLDALAVLYQENRNTSNLLKSTRDNENTCTLMNKILENLLDREHEKFLKALKNKLSKENLNLDLDNIYSRDEQLRRIIGFVIFGDASAFCEIHTSVPADLHDEYLEVINTQLPQHPYLCAKERKNGGSHYIFTGPAFRDYVNAYALSMKDDIAEYVREFWNDKGKYSPSQMLIQFYELFSGNKIHGKDISLMCKSFKANARLGNTIQLSISGAPEDCSVKFTLNKNENSQYVIVFDLIDSENEIYIDHLSNCFIDIEGKVIVGDSTAKQARVYNAVIFCSELIWNCEQVLIEAYGQDKCIIYTDQFCNSIDKMPFFEIKTDDKSNIRISASNLGNYYKLSAYKDDNILEMDDAGFESFSQVVRRIFNCLRSHSKDTPARKMEFIDNKIVGINERKKSILDFLIYKGILYTDEQNWLYKLDTAKLSLFSISWNDINNGVFSTLANIYKEYLEFMNIHD